VITKARGVAAAAAFTLLAAGLSVAENYEAAGRKWWAHVQFLAGDNLQGRAPGSSGFDLAADYVAGQFQRAGLRPGGIENYFQPVKLTQITLDESNSSIQLVQSGKTTDVKLGDDAILGVNPSSSPTIDAPLVFVGYGLSIPEANWNDLTSPALKGAIAVYLRGGPSHISGNLRSHYSSTGERWKAMKAAGAIGMIALLNPKDMEMSWQRISASRLTPRMVLADPALQETTGEEFTAAWNPDRSQTLFDGAQHNFAEILADANQGKALPHFALPARLNAKTSFKEEPVLSKNVVGIRWGTDPKLSHEFVVLSAHLDHLGEAPVTKAGDRIYNGAMDNASGIASLIEIAGELRHKKVQTKRSLIFLAVTAEEKGELGSKYYANHPSVEGRYVADINMDMYLPLFPLKYLEVQGLNESTLGDDIRAVCQAARVEVQPDQEPNKNLFIRSDQYSFVKEGVPGLAFKFGYLPGSPQEKVSKDWFSQRYHNVTDDLNQPVDASAAARFDDILTTLTIKVANAPEPPAWKPDSFFRRFVRASAH
jgi:Zn-dependent M28 family amino/carboxypeptidase